MPRRWKARPVQILLGVEHWTDPAEQPTDRTSLQQYDVDTEVLAR
jgi:hypothetical protein